MTFKELKQAIEEIDIKMRPLALYINPQDDKKLRECISDLEHRVLIISTPFIDPGKALLINRSNERRCGMSDNKSLCDTCLYSHSCKSSDAGISWANHSVCYGYAPVKNEEDGTEK